ncbi:MAG: alpha/beta hydrolase [Caldilineaceae bacterium]|nr:alpha/beta hydrolase [Caldilineaceae bacterium]
MITKRIQLRPDNEAVYLDLYLLNNSAEFQTDQPRPAVIVCPGGGYFFTSDREAEPIALRFLAHGYHVFVLRYSVETLFPQPMIDLAKTIALIRKEAGTWLVDPQQIAVCGFSAGGHLAASSGVLWNQPWFYEPLGVEPAQIKPNALILAYPVIDLTLVAGAPRQLDADSAPVALSELILTKTLGVPQPSPEQLARYRADRHVSAATPPTFIWHTADDELVPARNALLFATALAEQGVPYEIHIFDQGVHGLALADEVTQSQGRFLNPDCQIWVSLALAWLKRQFG